MIKVKFEFYYLFLVTIQAIFLFFTYQNYKYYSKNLKSFQEYFLNKFINFKEDTSIKNELGNESPS